MATSEEPRGTVASYPTGQHLRCEICGAEITIVKSCTAQPPDQVLQCCGKDLRPSTPELSEETWEG